jgi:hypothetical protein
VWASTIHTSTFPAGSGFSGCHSVRVAGSRLLRAMATHCSLSGEPFEAFGHRQLSPIQDGDEAALDLG